jgi:hypothetical protein
MAHLALLTLGAIASLAHGDEIAWGDVAPDGSIESRSLDVPVAAARGSENFFIPNPMDVHDWYHTSVVRKTLAAELKEHADGSSKKLQRLEESLSPIFNVMPKDGLGRLNNGTARYALHRFFSEKHGWFIKGLQPAGASWVSSLSVTPDVKDLTKYMVPSFLQDVLLSHLNADAFDLRSLSILAASIEHLIHGETIAIVYDIFTTLGLPIPGDRTEDQVEDVIDTFLMVHAFGLNLDVSTIADVKKAKAHLERSHSGWSQLQAFAMGALKSNAAKGQATLNFQEIVQVAKKIGEQYVQWQNKDCMRAKKELATLPSHREGLVDLSEIQPSRTTGGRDLFTESREDLERLGVLGEGASKDEKLIIPNYINSQSMCLSTASFYQACCMNECESILSVIERSIAAPAAQPSKLAESMKALPGLRVSDALMQALHNLGDKDTGLVSLHGRPLAEWMHQAFPLECSSPSSQEVTNPKTPDEWMGESGNRVAKLEEMMEEIANTLSRYTTMGSKGDQQSSDEELVSDPESDVVRTLKRAPARVQIGRTVITVVFRLAAMLSMMALFLLSAHTNHWRNLWNAGADKIDKSYV